MKVGHVSHPLIRNWPGYHYVKVDRSTPLGNPFHIGPDGTREEVIKKYAEWLPGAYKKGSLGVRAAIDNLVERTMYHPEEVVLLCWCHPRACHADVIKSFVEERVRDAKKKRTNSRA